MACQATSKPTKLCKPLKMSLLLSGPWERFSAEFCGPLPSGDYLFVIVDEYSRYPVVETVKSVSSATTIPVLDKVISMFGIPKGIKTDNGSSFNSSQFAKYAENIGFDHRKITPCWPRANAQAEAFNKPLMKTIKDSHLEHKNWKQEMYKFLRQHRATPHYTSGLAPHRLMFSREPNTKLPEIPQTKCKPEHVVVEEILHNKDSLGKSKMKSLLYCTIVTGIEVRD
ncbi:uncharacterized protein K02A2.6-like [Ylistrum balloti]|uniref:uncharacterized protein K02A2.6-like n=1 Tax=Ylistrum balloti TaxID=509963 RepID=UPI002905842F|nr:uncharacterized protein K02A2.6-like [Ylistrum balloti]